MFHISLPFVVAVVAQVSDNSNYREKWHLKLLCLLIESDSKEFGSFLFTTLFFSQNEFVVAIAHCNIIYKSNEFRPVLLCPCRKAK